MTVVLISFCALIATFLGGGFALRFKDSLHLILGFSAGAVLGVAFFDLMPEAIRLGAGRYDVSTMLLFVVIGYLLFTILDRNFINHSHHSTPLEQAHHEHDDNVTPRGKLAATSLSLHSFLDGTAIGLAFKVSPAVGVIVATAVLVHDFSDGINTVNLILKNGGTRKEAFRWLAVDAIAPVVGATSTLFYSLPESALAVVLALFSGFFLYLSASDLLPESYHAHPTRWTTFSTILGATVIFFAIKLAGI
jgi:zinc transporter ZupT